MRLSTKTRYGSRALVRLALHAGAGLVSLKEISQREEISQKYLEQLFSALQAAGLVRAERGARGGYELARPAAEITLRQVYEVLEGGDGFAPCESGIEDCERAARCVTREVWRRMYAASMAVLEETTLADLAAEAEAQQAADASMYHI